MKKVLFGMLMLLACASASAQKGEKAIGANMSYGTEIENLGLGIKGQYSFTDNWRGEASFDYFFKKNNVSMWDLNANVHYLFNVGDGINVYPLAGLGYSNWNVSGSKTEFTIAGITSSVEIPSVSNGELAVNLGGGVEYLLDNNWKINAELKFQIINNYNQAVLSVGCAYRF